MGRLLALLPVHRGWVWVPAAVAALLLGLVIIATERLVADELTSRALSRVDQHARQYVAQISHLLEQRASELELLSRVVIRSPEVVEHATIRHELQQLKDRSDHIVWIGWIDPEGTVLAAPTGCSRGSPSPPGRCICKVGRRAGLAPCTHRWR